MGAITLSKAQARYDMWLKAEEAVATGQSYQMGNRSLTRANLYQIREQLKYWENKVNELEIIAKRGSRRRITSIIPRGL